MGTLMSMGISYRKTIHLAYFRLLTNNGARNSFTEAQKLKTHSRCETTTAATTITTTTTTTTTANTVDRILVFLHLELSPIFFCLFHLGEKTERGRL